MSQTFYQDDTSEIEALLLGNTVVKVDAETLVLDDGRVLKLAGNDGGCSCGAGDYDLTELNGVDNIITKVEFVNKPSGDEHYSEDEGFYRIFVFADNERVNLATFEGTDGNGYYGTGYSITVHAPAVTA